MRVQQHPLLAGGGAVCPNFAAGQIFSIPQKISINRVGMRVLVM